MKRTVLTIILIPGLLMAYSNNKDFKEPDYNGIKKIIKDTNSIFFYFTLMERYRSNDTTLNLQDFRVLYYGSFFQNSYSPYGFSDYSDSLSLILRKDTLTIEDYLSIVKYEKQILNEYPFNLRNLYTLAEVSYLLEDTVTAAQAVFKLNMLIETILSTGNGEKEKSAWHVISVSHEYDMLNFLGFQFAGSQSLTENGCDYLEVEKNEYNIEGFYFDVNMILQKQSELFSH